MDRQIEKQLYTEILWYKCNNLNLYGEVIPDKPVKVPCYSWDEDKVIISNAGVQIRTSKNFIVQLDKYPMKEEDEVEIRGIKYPIKVIKRYANPFNRKNVTGVICI